MIDKSELIDARTDFINLIKEELLGPGSEISIPDKEHELISDAPNVRYSVGILYTKEQKMKVDSGDTIQTEGDENISDETISSDVVNEQESEYTVAAGSRLRDDDNEINATEDNLDEEVGLATQNLPSSMGITFFAKGNSDKVLLNLGFGTYRKALSNDCRIPIKLQGEEKPDIISPVSDYVFFDEKEGTLRLLAGGLNGKKIHEIEEKDVLGDDKYGIISKMRKLSDQLAKGYVREDHKIQVELDYQGEEYIDRNKEIDKTNLKITSLRKHIREDIYSITIMLVNDCDKKAKADLCIYQPIISVETKNNGFIFVEYNESTDFASMDDEEKSLALQYRNKKVYGTGLGTSIGWDINNNGDGRIFSDYIPESEVPSMDFKLPDDSGVLPETLSMKYLSDLNDIEKEEKTDKLKTLVNAYCKWIDELSKKSEKLGNGFKEVAKKNIEGCRFSAERMKNGINVLESDSSAWIAFQLANRAMFMQRAHLKLQSKTSNINRYPGDEELSNTLDEIDYRNIEKVFEDSYSWRPFQLAFLLMSIPSITFDKSDDRELVDLIWFPTGGGKTEAYLGLTAFTIFYRRLSHIRESSGTTVIMRYTLRLLAAQQFTRASTLICACEYIRVDATSKRSKYGKYPLGDERITIGLWIGSDHTPNKNKGGSKSAEKELKCLREASAEELETAKDRHNKFQVLKCPWCGTKMVKDRVDKKMIGTFGYRMRNNAHFELFCPQESCFFNQEGSLPIQVVDEELYSNPPTLLFGTVDKFAMLPWRAEIGSFFAVNSANRSPELIIQDELHLISGPLGTMVGLYEGAIDAICEKKGVKTKIIASTATIRRAAEQCASLYDRQVMQFPHPGIDAEDSFFARESVVNYEKQIYGRKYIGIMPSGKTKAMMEIRAIASALQKINTMELPYEVKDKFWTLTVYFNSLKDLGRCSTLVDDDVKDFIKRIAYRTGDSRDARMITSADELTSRVSTTQLNETLDKLEKTSYSKENIENKRYPSNVLLATNMISVGIDVSRLNVMILVGQPKLTSEYIQASSRIGREYPGVAFALYDGSKSRDRSHYEQFRGYHESFYRFVEPTGVTPFSKPARERALRAVVIAMIRQFIPELREEKAAGLFSRDNYRDEINKIVDYIVERSNSVTARVNPDMDSDEDDIRNEINHFLTEWEQLENGYKDAFFYGDKFMFSNPEEGQRRLMKPYNTSPNDPAFDTMTSMRNVDITVGSSIVFWEE